MAAIELTKEQAAEIAAFLDDFPKFAATCWRVLTKPPEARYVPFRLNAAQALCEAALADQGSKRKPMRLKVLKYRQAGVSTWASARMQHAAMTRPGTVAISLADKQDLPAQWLRRCKTWHEQTPPEFRTELTASNALEMYYAGIDSRYFVGSQAGQTPGMGYALAGFHGSELANWNAGKYSEVLDDLIPSIPRKPGTIIILESTGEVVGDAWYHAYQASKRGEDEYAALFLPWFVHGHEYRDEQGAADILDLTPAETEIVRLAKLDYGIEVDKAMLAWRRAGIAGEPYHGDEQAFDGKFPSTDEQAFLSAGRNVFTREQVAAARKTVRVPIWWGDILPDRNPQTYTIDSGEGGRLCVWEKPDKRQHYVIGADVQWGRKDTNDYDAAYVVSANTGRVVARWWGRCDMGDWAKTLASLGWYYSTSGNPACLAPERNSEAARGVILPLLGLAGNDWRYPNLYVRTKNAAYGALRPEDYGWLTDEHSKPDLIIRTKESLNSRGGMDWADRDAVDELSSYIVDDKAKFTAPDGQHDDRLMARMIAHRVYLDVNAELVARGMESDYGELTDWQHRLVEHIEKQDGQLPGFGEEI